jgi:pyocin large subunit-like protein
MSILLFKDFRAAKKYFKNLYYSSQNSVKFTTLKLRSLTVFNAINFDFFSFRAISNIPSNPKTRLPYHKVLEPSHSKHILEMKLKRSYKI